MLEQTKRKQNHYMRQSIKEEIGKDASVDDVLTHLLGDRDGHSDSDYVVYKYEFNFKRTLLNRVNFLWVYPLFICSIPFSWILTGNIGITRTSKVGRIVDKLVKFDN